jgi:glutamate/tyrosine decarboxylase-like PLP-dependent enzyme
MNQSKGNFQVDLKFFQRMLQKDLESGLIPFWYGCSWGSPLTCAYDQIDLIGDICKQYGIWLDVDASYAGCAWIVPEYQQQVKGLEKAD